MFHILGFLFIIIIAILLIGLSIIGTVIRSIFGLGGRRTSSSRGYSYNENGPSSNPTSGETELEEGEIHPKHKKLFSENEGEYVDFEEIKE
jgi:hypothetical protein